MDVGRLITANHRLMSTRQAALPKIHVQIHKAPVQSLIYDIIQYL